MARQMGRQCLVEFGSLQGSNYGDQGDRIASNIQELRDSAPIKPESIWRLKPRLHSPSLPMQTQSNQGFQ
ncbi:hypothetical protein [Leptodesmis sp.]|uniref:hypothetical protein n=1 Tax=Leptodesmis sp. TaxID=3100501 RepID=UPI0040534FD8